MAADKTEEMCMLFADSPMKVTANGKCWYDPTAKNEKIPPRKVA